MTDDQGQSKGFGFVYFETQEAADKAIDKTNGMLLGNNKVIVGPFISSKSARVVQVDNANSPTFLSRTLMIEWDDDKLRELLRNLMAKSPVAQ